MSKKEIHGIKELATYISGRKCDYFIESKETEKKLKKISRFHNEIVKRIHEFLKRLNPIISCDKEYKIKFEKTEIPGRIDLVCIDYTNNTAYIVEVKSYNILKFDIKDYFQLLYYVKYIVDNRLLEGYKIVPWLVYRMDKKLVILDLSKLNSQDLSLIKTYYTSNLIPGYWCKYCSRRNCPFYQGDNV